MRIRIALINFYFGPFPDYFPLFLKSCENNPEIIWHIYTDNDPVAAWPANVVCHRISFDACRELFQSRFPYEISLNSPKKLCDYKPLYGYILQDLVRDYDFWGHCDLDVIWGQIRIPEAYFDSYDRLYSLGHFSLYRTAADCTDMILNYQDGRRLRQVLQTEDMVAFDEWGPDNTNAIYASSSLRFLTDSYGADIWPVSYSFSRSAYNPATNRYYPIADSMGILRMEKGRLFYYYKNGRVEEVPYVHLQKRQFSHICGPEHDSYYITPDAFVAGDVDAGLLLERACRKPLLDRQFWKIKKINLRRRLEKIRRR